MDLLAIFLKKTKVVCKNEKNTLRERQLAITFL